MAVSPAARGRHRRQQLRSDPLPPLYCGLVAQHHAHVERQQGQHGDAGRQSQANPDALRLYCVCVMFYSCRLSSGCMQNSN